MWLWLKNNSAAVQGLAAALSVLVTIILAVLTAWYVVLTRRLLLTAQTQAISVDTTARTEKLHQATRTRSATVEALQTL